MRLFKDSKLNTEDKLFVSSSLHFIREENNEYEINAAIPDFPAKQNSDFQYTQNLNDFEIHNSLYFFKLDDNKITDIANNLCIQGVNSQDELFDLLSKRKNVSDIFKNKLSAYFSKYTELPFNLHEIYVGGKKQITSTIDFDLIPNKKTGLHVDNWDKLPISDLTSSKNRICINLGKSHRYFLFINKSVMEIKDEVYGNNSEYSTCENSNEIAKYFLMHDKNLQICFFKLDPFEGYIAPTENLIHDASNFDSDATDIQVTARGYFKIPMK